MKEIFFRHDLEFEPLPRGSEFSFEGKGFSKEEIVLQVAKKLDHPFYFYHVNELRTHMQAIQKEAKGIAKLWYACKANPLSSILQVMDECQMNFDIASPGELAQVLRQNISPAKILCTGPAKSKALLAKYLFHGLKTFVCESYNQLKWLNEVASEQNKIPQVLLRLQIRWPKKDDKNALLGGNDITPFGLEASEWQKIDLSQFKNLSIEGVHTFQWGNILSENQLGEIWEQATNHCQDLAHKMNFKLNIIDLGGGVGIPYRLGEKSVDWKKLMTILSNLKKQFKLPEIWLELGRFAVGEFGSYVTKIIDLKKVSDKDILVLDSGMNQLARPSLTKQGFPLSVLCNQNQNLKTYQIHGPLCTALDFLGDYELADDLKIGDWLLFKQCGAYGFTESMPYFLCHSLPGEAVFKGEKNEILELIRMPRPAFHYLV